MPPSLDFNWQEGGEGSEQSIDDVQDPATFSPRSSTLSSRHSKKNAAPPPWGYLILLAVGVVLGLALGFVVLTAIGQYNARADFSPIVELKHEALAQGDRDLYINLFDPEEQIRLERLEMLDVSYLLAGQSYDVEDGPPDVSKVHMLGDHAEIEIKFGYDKLPDVFRRLENLRKVDGQWRYTREVFPVWGNTMSAEREHITVSYRERDDFLVDMVPLIEMQMQSLCKTYRLTEPCQIEIEIQPDGDWPPNIPVNGVGPLSIISPRLVGLSSDFPFYVEYTHPLWFGTLYESIEEMIARRSE